MKIQSKILLFYLVLLLSAPALAQEKPLLSISGELLTDQRFLFKNDNEWAWNENRLTLELDKKVNDKSKFHSEIWVRNLGVPNIGSSSQLYNKGIMEPYDIEVREAYIELYKFLLPKLDVKIGRQRLAWGTADKLNPTDNLNPYDLEDIIDFGRHRASDAISMEYYFNHDYSLQLAYIPFFKPWNMPVGLFSDILVPESPANLGQATSLIINDQVVSPDNNLGSSATFGACLSGFAFNFDFALNYLWGYDGQPFITDKVLFPYDTIGGIQVDTRLDFSRNHIFGASIAGTIGGFGIWSEVAVTLPDTEIRSRTDLTQVFGTPIVIDTVLLKKESYVKYIIGTDYHLGDGSYFNFQYLHGFFNERGKDNLNDYFFMRFEKPLFNNKLLLSLINGGFVVSEWDDIKNNYALLYLPEIKYTATPNTHIYISSVIFKGKGSSTFSGLDDYNMFMLKVEYSF